MCMVDWEDELTDGVKKLKMRKQERDLVCNRISRKATRPRHNAAVLLLFGDKLQYFIHYNE